MKTPRTLTWLILPVILVGIGSLPVMGQPADPPSSESDEDAPSPDEVGMTVADALVMAFQSIEAAEAGGPNATVYAAQAFKLANYVDAKEPKNPQATFIVGRVKLLQGRYSDAMQFLREYSETRQGSNDWLVFKLLGDIMLMGKYYELAQAKYEQALALNSGEPTIHLALAQVKLDRVMYDEAVGHAQEAIKLFSDPREALGQARESLAQVKAARAVLRKGSDARAEEKLVKATENLAKANVALNNALAASEIIAQANLELKNFPEAETAAQKSRELAQERVRLMPYDMERLNQLNEALLLTLTALERRQALSPDQADVYIEMAKVIQEQADLVCLMTWHQALQRLELGVNNTAPNVPPNLLMEYAKLQYNVGRTDDAVTSLDFLLQKNPDHAEALKLREQIAGPLPASAEPTATP